MQYQETDLAFISRLAEHAGISFFFEHQDGQDTMVFTDDAGGSSPRPAPSPSISASAASTRDVFELEARSRARRRALSWPATTTTGNRMLDLTAEHVLSTGYAGGIVEYGGHYKTPEEGKDAGADPGRGAAGDAARLCGQEHRCARSARAARSVLEGAPEPGVGSICSFVEVEHRRRRKAPGGQGGGDEPRRYANAFRAIARAEHATGRRASRRRPGSAASSRASSTPGPAGRSNDAQIDDQGRYMVRFLFDTAAQPAARRPGRCACSRTTPERTTARTSRSKPGTEVLIAFVNGDPDRPVIVGAAPNPLTPSPVNSANRSTHRIKTQGGIVFDLVDE